MIYMKKELIIICLILISTVFISTVSTSNNKFDDLFVSSIDINEPNEFNIFFNKDVDIESAKNISNYYISGVVIYSAVLQNSNEIILTTSNHSFNSTTYYIKIENVKDVDGNVMQTYSNSFSQGETSLLWGNNGELWNPLGRIADFSYAGYHSGNDPLPDIPVVANVLDFGAIPNDKKIDTQAFINAIASTENGAILIPEGRYIIDDIIYINKSNVVLRGEGSNTILYFTRNLFEIYPGFLNWRSAWGGLIWLGKNFNYPTPKNDTTGLGRKLTNITENAEKGDTLIKVLSKHNLTEGEYIIIKMEDDEERTMYSSFQRAGSLSDAPAHLCYTAQIKSICDDYFVELEEPLEIDIQTNWNTTIYEHDGIKESGVENLQIDFPDVLAQVHLGAGYNGICFYWALNCWTKNIIINNCDLGETFIYSSKCTIDGIILPQRNYPYGSFTGHHGIAFVFNAMDNMVTNFNIDSKFHHDFANSHLCHHNVVRNGRGIDINFDHHRDTPFSNLFTDINIGYGRRPYSSGGNDDQGSYSGDWNVFWNIKTIKNTFLRDVDEYHDEWEDDMIITIIPSSDSNVYNPCHWVEKLNSITPSDLYLAQYQKRLGININVEKEKNDILIDDITVSTDYLEVTNVLWINATIINNGIYNESITIDLRTENNPVKIKNSTTISLNPNEQKIVNIEWNTDELLNNKNIYLILKPISNEKIMWNNHICKENIRIYGIPEMTINQTEFNITLPQGKIFTSSFIVKNNRTGNLNYNIYNPIKSILYYNNFNIPYDEDEDDRSYWNHYGVLDEWEHGEPNVSIIPRPPSSRGEPNVPVPPWHSPPEENIRYCWGTDLDDKYEIGSLQYLESPLINIDYNENILLSFKYFLSLGVTISYPKPGRTDLCCVDVSLDEGNSWITNNNISSTVEWKDACYDLSNYSNNSTLKIRFKLQSICGNPAYGLYVENVQISNNLAWLSFSDTNLLFTKEEEQINFTIDTNCLPIKNYSVQIPVNSNTVNEILTINLHVVPSLCDLDHDGDNDDNDFFIFKESFGYSIDDPEYNIEADYDGDGVISFVDYQLWLEYYHSYNNS